MDAAISADGRRHTGRLSVATLMPHSSCVRALETAVCDKWNGVERAPVVTGETHSSRLRAVFESSSSRHRVATEAHLDAEDTAPMRRDADTGMDDELKTRKAGDGGTCSEALIQ